MPGALPVMNHQALKLTALTGLMLGCKIPPVCKFDRKNYFYPDMPKNYQISQYDLPLCLGGSVPLHALAYPKDVQKEMEGKDKAIPLTRIHLEEDVAKSFHFDSSTGIDFNRAGTPLMEIVSDPDIATPEEAFAYLTSLKQILHYGGVSDADQEKGQMRCDCNISLRPEGQKELGTKIEIKNMNTISGVRSALAFEIERQTACLDRGEVLLQETRRWNDQTGQADLMCIEESEADYRYFPDPDLLPVQTDAIVAEVTPLVPELPTKKRARFAEQYGVSSYDAGVLANDLPLAAYFEKAAANASKPKTVANWILNELPPLLNAASLTIEECPIQPESLNELVCFLDEGKINGKQGKEVFAEMFATGKAAAVIIEEKGLKQESDLGAIATLCDQVIAANPKAVEEYKSGKLASINFLKGQVMKLSKGKANPGIAGDVLARKLA